MGEALTACCARRTTWNFGLQRAVERATELRKPLLVLEPLNCDYRWASDRLHRFILDGMAENGRRFARNPVFYYPYVEPAKGAGKGLLVALAYRPELLLLDEPSSGLDPIVRRDILGAIVRTIADEGRTVLFSSHLLDEVERVSDCVAMLKAGQLVFAGELANIQHTHHQLTLRTDNADLQPAFLGLLDCQRRGNEWTAIASGDLDDLTIAASSIGAQIIDHRRLSLDEIFLARVGAQSDIPAGAARL